MPDGVGGQGRAASCRSRPCRCAASQVDNDDHLYLAGADRRSRPTTRRWRSTCAGPRAIHHNLASVIFSLEMTRNEITMRLLSAEARIPLNHMRNGHMTDDDWQQARPQDGRGLLGAAVHRRQPEHDDDGDPGQGPPAQAAPRPAADRHRLPAADDVGQEGRVPPARGLGVLPADQAAGQGARRPGRRALAAQPWSRAAHRQATDADRPPRVGLPDRRHAADACRHQRRGHPRRADGAPARATSRCGRSTTGSSWCRARSRTPSPAGTRRSTELTLASGRTRRGHGEPSLPDLRRLEAAGRARRRRSRRSRCGTCRRRSRSRRGTTTRSRCWPT